MIRTIPLLQNQLLAIIRLAVTGETDDCLMAYTIDWTGLYSEAEKQCLLGIVFAGIEQLPMDKRPDMACLANWLWQAQHIKTINEHVNKRAIELAEKTTNAGFEYIILKGQGVAQLYESSNGVNSSNSLSSLRTSGDIDIWLKGTREDILKFAQEQGEVDRIVYHNVETKIFPDVNVEVHFTPSWLCNYFRNRKLQRWFKDSFEECYHNKIKLGDAGEISIPTLKFNRVFILQHIYRHLFGDGIGLRQLIDYYMVLRASSYENRNNGSSWIQETMTRMKELGMGKFCSAVMWVLGQIFEPTSFKDSKDQKVPDWMLCKPNKKEGLFLLEEILRGGNFGHSDDRIIHPENENKLHSFFRITKQNMRFIKHYPNEVLWNPVYRAWHYMWRKHKGYKVVS